MSLPLADLALAEVAAAQLGVFTAADARRAGYTADDVRAELGSLRWTRRRRGVYVETAFLAGLRGDSRALHQLDCAAVLVSLHPRVVVSHSSAARLIGVPLPGSEPTRVRLTDPGNWRTGRGYHVAQAELPEPDLVALGRFRRTGVARTLVDCAREWQLVDAVISMDDALHRRLLTPVDLRDAVLAQRHWEGIGGAARAAGLADGRAESPLETAGRVHIARSGLPVPELQVSLYDEQGFIGRVDGWYEDAALVVEFDGAVKYRDPSGGRSAGDVLWQEKRREDRMRAAGARVMRIADADIWAGWPPTRERLRAQLAAPSQRTPALRVVRRPSGSMAT